MQVDVLARVVTAVVTTMATGFAGWLVKALTGRLDAYMEKSEKWREGVDSALAELQRDSKATKEASQVNMRQNLLHYAEKYITRGWLTPEERAAIYEMHQKYTALDANGYIDGYMTRVMALPDREV